MKDLCVTHNTMHGLKSVVGMKLERPQFDSRGWLQPNGFPSKQWHITLKQYMIAAFLIRTNPQFIPRIGLRKAFCKCVGHTVVGTLNCP